jgi:hypothetical protein
MSGLAIIFVIKLFEFSFLLYVITEKGVVRERMGTTLFPVRQQIIQLLPSEFRNSVRRSVGDFL